MKGRSVKLKEAHKSSNGGASSCFVLYGGESRHLVTSSASNSGIAIHNLVDPSESPVVLHQHKDGVTAIALSPNSACLASGSLDHSVKIFKFPGGEFQSNITRFTLPIRSLAFNKSGSLLAAAGDDEGIKLIATVDGTISRVFKGHKGSVTGLAFDPANDYLASVDETGTVIIWELSSGNQIHNLKSIAPNFSSDHSVLNVLSWSPDGEILAVPGLKNDVVMYDRDTADKLFTLRGDHEKPICFLSWTPNGKYMATSSLDKQVLIWDIEKRQDIDRQKFDDRISCLAWDPNGNALALINVMGKFGIWESVIPSRMRSPVDGVPNTGTNGKNGLLFFDEDDEEHRSLDSLNNVGAGSPSESFPAVRKRLRNKSLDENPLEEFSDEEVDSFHPVTHKKASIKSKDYTKDKRDELCDFPKLGKHKMQASFQPGSTPLQAGKRRFLCYNMLGSISTVENDGLHHVEVDFHDTGIGPRVPAMTDHFGFTMAALDESGSVFANPGGDKSMSTLMYRPFSSWANNSEWSMRFEDEGVKAVALGKNWVAAVTNLNFLRIFSHGGLQRCIISLDGPVVTAVGYKDLLAVVTHASDCMSTDDQILELKVFGISNGSLLMRGPLPLTPGACLTWFGFGEEGQLSSYDSKGILRIFSHQFGGSWLPLFSASKEKKTAHENYWVVGLNASKLFCVVCKSPDSYPLVTPKPVLTLLPLSFPVASSDLGANCLENDFLVYNLNLSQIQKGIEEASSMGLDPTELDDKAFNLEAALDRCILDLIESCCNGDKLVRAVELAQLLSFGNSLRCAIKLATDLKRPILAERFNGILEEKLSSETCIGVMASVGVHAGLPVDAGKNKSPASSMLSSSLETKQGQLDGNSKSKLKDLDKKYAAANSDNVHQPLSHVAKNPIMKTPPKIEKAGPVKIEKEKMTSQNECLDILMENGEHVQRPKNPFAKASTKEKSSLFDSIKKMKVDRAKTRL